MSASTANSIISKTPASICGRMPIWFGGHADADFRRAAKYGDGFMPLAYPAGEAALAAFAKLRGLTQEAGRDPVAIGLEDVGFPRHRHRGGLAPRDRLLERGRGNTFDAAHDLCQRPSQAHCRPHVAVAAITRYRAAVADLLSSVLETPLQALFSMRLYFRWH